MKLRKFSNTLLVLIALSVAGPVFAEKIGVTVPHDKAIEIAVSNALKGAGHEIVDVSAAAKGVKLDAASAAAIGKKTGAQIIVSGKKVGNLLVIKVLSTKNDTVVGGTSAAGDAAATIAQVKKLMSDNKAKLVQ